MTSAVTAFSAKKTPICWRRSWKLDSTRLGNDSSIANAARTGKLLLHNHSIGGVGDQHHNGRDHITVKLLLSFSWINGNAIGDTYFAISFSVSNTYHMI